MAYRRRQGASISSTFKDPPPPSPSPDETETSSPVSLAAQAMRASSAHRDSSISSAYGDSAIPSSNRPSSYTTLRDSSSYEYTSMKNLNESKYGFWGVLARKAKSLIDDEKTPPKFENIGRKQPQFLKSYQSPEGYQKAEAPPSQKSPDSIASSLNHIGGTIKNALEEGLTIVENRTADIIQETRKRNIRRKGSSSTESQATDKSAQHSLPHVQADHETQLMASRDVANAMAAKAKLLLRELKTVKADLAFAKERCAQLEEENKLLRESRDDGDSIEDDDLIRLQLETMLAEKGRLARENSIYARENRFLREIVEYHQLTMRDVVHVDEGVEEVTEVCPVQLPPHLPDSNSPGHLSPITSRPGSSNNSANTSPRYLNIGDAPDVFLTAGSASPTTPSPREMHVEAKAASLPSSPKAQILMRQPSLTPS